MKAFARVGGALAVLMVVGAGCFGGKSTAAPSQGGAWQSADGGKNWVEKNVLLTAQGNGTLANIDILSLARDPQDPAAIYAGTTSSGILTSLDAGQSWTRPAAAAAREGAILSIAVDPKNVCTVYALKPDRLLKTTTCGRTWETERYVESQPKVTLTALALDWFNPGVLYLGNTDGAIIQSKDAGATWATVQRMRQPISSLLISNADSRIILAGTTRDGIARSSDGGITWTSLEEALKSYREADRVKLFAQSGDGSSIVVATEYGLLRSTDGGATWLPLSLVSGAGDVAITALGVAPKDGNVIYYGTRDSFVQTTNAGTSWTVSENPTTRAISAILVDDINPTQVTVGLKNLEK